MIFNIGLSTLYVDHELNIKIGIKHKPYKL
jgi:hypothetical protein